MKAVIGGMAHFDTGQLIATSIVALFLGAKIHEWLSPDQSDSHLIRFKDVIRRYNSDKEILPKLEEETREYVSTWISSDFAPMETWIKSRLLEISDKANVSISSLQELGEDRYISQFSYLRCLIRYSGIYRDCLRSKKHFPPVKDFIGEENYVFIQEHHIKLRAARMEAPWGASLDLSKLPNQTRERFEILSMVLLYRK